MTPDARDDSHERFPLRTALPPAPSFRVFEFDKPGGPTPPEFPGEHMSLGRWVGVSGAAFSTGTGYHTSLGLSLLAGLANVRLGYWWDSRTRDVNRYEVAEKGAALDVKQDDSDLVHASAAVRRRRSWLRRILLAIVPVQTYMISEFIARFPGTAHRYWYLTDGGHFENMGGYELIRRRLPVVIIIDAEQDEAYEFEGLSNLVRKARTDFQTRISFPDWTDESPDPSGRTPSFGLPLSALIPEKKKDEPIEGLHLSKACLAIGRIDYPDDGAGPTTGVLIYIKPVLQGDEPADVIQYARTNRTFPHQSTADQFFNEAQWESYRRLGEHIAAKVLVTGMPSGASVADFIRGIAANQPV
jgi:hypothetical protein